MGEFFLPWQGEFGGYVTTFIRYVHTRSSSHKVVACPPDHRCLFPSADAFFHDYDEFLSDRKKRGRSNTPWVQKRIEELRDRICNEKTDYRDYDFIRPFMKLDCYKTPEIVKARFQPVIKRQGLTADVVITPRRRKYQTKKNLPFWQEIVDRLKSAGYTVGSVGVRPSRFPYQSL